MKKLLMLFLLCFVTGINLITAQNRSATGIVVSEEDDQPIIGASVLVKGTTLGTITDIDGKFRISNIPETAKVIQVSYIGMETQELPIKKNLKVSLRTGAQNLDEVVVVAYGTASKQSLTGAVAAVDSKELEMRPVTDATSAIEGTAPGIQVNNSYGEPGSNNSKIRIRGFGSVNGTNAPLIVVDGSPYNGDITDINSSDIESISTLKDAASCALYGNKAANGVVLITTKKGKNSKLNVRASIKQGIYNRAIPQYDKIGINDWMQTIHDGYVRYAKIDKGITDDAAAIAYANENVMAVIKSNIFDKPNNELYSAEGKFIGKKNNKYTDLDWMAPIERNGHRQEYNMSADAGSDKYDFFSSFSYLDEKGYIISSSFQRFTGRMKANFRPTKWFKAGVNLSGTISTSYFTDSAKEEYAANPFYTATHMAPVYPYYKHEKDGTIVKDEKGNPVYDINNQDYLGGRNLIYELKNNETEYKRNVLSGQVYGTFYLPYNIQATVKGDTYSAYQNNKEFGNPFCGDGASNNGRLFKSYLRTNDYRFAQELYWSKDFDKHHIDVLAAHESFKHEVTYDYNMKSNQKIFNDNYTPSNFTEMTQVEGNIKNYTTESYLSRARYNYDNRYFFDASFRRDGSSRFYHPWGEFFSFGASWDITGEDFMKPYKFVDFLKLRASYGQVGNDAGVDFYAYKNLYTSELYNKMGAYYTTQHENKDLKWETSSTLDIAIEGRLFDRVNFSFDFFNKISDNLLFDVNFPLSAGATDWESGMATVYKNIGSVRNTGLEVAVDVDVLRKRDWKWNVGLNLTTIHNEISKLPEGKDIPNGLRRFSEGHSIYEFYTYTYAGVDKNNGRALYNANTELEESKIQSLKAKGEWITLKDKNNVEHDYVYNSSNGKKDWKGSALPDVYGSLTSALTWKDLTLSVLCTYSIGGQVYDSGYKSLMRTTTNGLGALHKDVLDTWKGTTEKYDATTTDRIASNATPAFDLSSQDSFSQGTSDRWLVDASYFVIKNVNLSYNVPKSFTRKLGLGRLNLFGSIENLATFTARKGLNPQYSFAGAQDNTFVAARVYSFGLNLKF